jgi:hypothetical protein
MDSSFIFIGSTHGFMDDFLKQKEIILAVKPEFVLCEELENLTLDSKERFEKLCKKREISNMTSFEEVEKLIELCFRENIKLIGIDFKNFGFDENLQKKIKNQENVSPKEEETLDKIMLLREKIHLDKILEYQKKTSKPLVIIMGSWHLREDSFLREKLENYKLILPCDRNNEPLFGPGEDKEVRYVEITSNGNQIKN